MSSPATLCFGHFELQIDRRRLLQDGHDIEIGARAFDVLVALVERSTRLVTKAELLDLVWPDVVVEENNLQVQVSGLRKLLGPQVISTIPGRGYRFVAALDDGTNTHAAAPAAPRPSDTPQDRNTAAGAAPTNVPARLPTLYGRDADLLALRSLVERHRLVTVVGAGGIGKTALAQSFAHALQGAFADGVWLVELAPVMEPSRLTDSVATALGVELGSDTSAAALARALSNVEMLIVLDNCEHLLNAAAELATALHAAAQGVRLLVTSQEPLKIPAEQVHRLGPLQVPGEADAATARDTGAIALFAARAGAVDPSFALTESNIDAVIEICRRLDGIALAIELAAARVPLLGVEGLRARLDERFRILAGGSRLALRRHQTLHAALAWSHGLLTVEEATVFRRLGVFVGSFGLDSAQHVAADPAIDEWSVLDQLGALVDKSLVVVDAGEAPRYRLLETTRAFALERLRDAGEADAVRRCHAIAMRTLFETSLLDEFRTTQQSHLVRYLPDLDNARAALDWSAVDDRVLHVALAGAIGWIWREAGLRPEGFKRVKTAVAMLDDATHPVAEARLWTLWSWLAHPDVGDDEIAANQRAVDLYRVIGDRQSLFLALCNQARFLPYLDRIAETEAVLAEAAGLLDDSWPIAMRVRLLNSRDFLLMAQGRYDDALLVNDEVLRVARAIGDSRLEVHVLINAEQNVASLGRLEESVSRGRVLLEMLRQDWALRSGNEHFVLVNLHMSLVRLDRVDEALPVARAAFVAGAALGRELDMVEQTALLALKRGRAEDAARMLGRAERAFAAGHARRDPVEQVIRDALLRGLRHAMPAEELSRLMAVGASMSIDEAMRLGLRD